MIWALHGAVGMAADWREYAASLPSELGGVRRLDLWRFLDCCPMPLEKFGDTLAGEITHVDPAPVLVGYSMGGRLALHALIARPDLWKAAIIISAHPGLSDEAERSERREKDAEWSALALKGGWSEFLQRWEAQSVIGGAGEMPDRNPLKGRRASIARSFIDWSLGAQADLSKGLKGVTCPVLWLTGERDGKFTEIAKGVVPDIPKAEHVIIPDCGHRVPWEKPREFSAACRDFLRRLP
jgi:2-succinyl-6-hydroxy-2,4-cyclohexadiene-1-carboxylate synthase